MKKRALVVGINDYGGHFSPNLPSCVQDALSMQDEFKGALGFSEIKVLKDSDATHANVVAGLDWLTNGVTSEDRIVFYFSGHGTTQPKGTVLEEYLVLYDNLLQDDDLSKKTQHLPDGVLTVILDCCYSGGMEKRMYEAVLNPTVNKVAEGFFSSAAPEFTVEHTLVKTRATEPNKINSLEKQLTKVTSYKPFGQVARLLPNGVTKAAYVAPTSDEVGQLELKGVLLSASLESETAAASTAQTKGLSAFTFCLLSTLHKYGYELPLTQLLRLVDVDLKRLNLRQTPILKGNPRKLENLTILLKNATVAAEAPKDADQAQTVMQVIQLLASLGYGNPQSSGNQFTQPQRRENMPVGTMDPSVIASIVSQVMERERMNAYNPYSQVPSNAYPTQEKFPWALVPVIISTVRELTKAPVVQQPTYQEKFGFAEIVPIVVAVAHALKSLEAPSPYVPTPEKGFPWNTPMNSADLWTRHYMAQSGMIPQNNFEKSVDWDALIRVLPDVIHAVSKSEQQKFLGMPSFPHPSFPTPTFPIPFALNR